MLTCARRSKRAKSSLSMRTSSCAGSVVDRLVKPLTSANRMLDRRGAEVRGQGGQKRGGGQGSRWTEEGRRSGVKVDRRGAEVRGQGGQKRGGGQGSRWTEEGRRSGVKVDRRGAEVRGQGGGPPPSPDVLVAVDVDPVELVLEVFVLHVCHVVDHLQNHKAGKNRQNQPLLEGTGSRSGTGRQRLIM